MSNNQIVGQYGEQLAGEFLVRNGYKILDKNYKTSYWEIDIIVAKEDFVVFVEVKTRTSTAYGDGVEAVDWQKQASLRKGISQYLYKKQPECLDVRADLITVMVNKNKKTVRIKHYKDIL